MGTVTLTYGEANPKMQSSNISVNTVRREQVPMLNQSQTLKEIIEKEATEALRETENEIQITEQGTSKVN